MKTQVTEMFNIEFPLFAFTHCRDVVVAVSKAGGFGVYAAGGLSNDQFEIDLKWIDAEKLPEVIVDFKKNLYLSLLKEIKLVID